MDYETPVWTGPREAALVGEILQRRTSVTCASAEAGIPASTLSQWVEHGMRSLEQAFQSPTPAKPIAGSFAVIRNRWPSTHKEGSFCFLPREALVDLGPQPILVPLCPDFCAGLAPIIAAAKLLLPQLAVRLNVEADPLGVVVHAPV